MNATAAAGVETVKTEVVGQPMLERTDPNTMVLLGLCTAGIFPLYRFWKAGQEYLALLPGRTSNFQTMLLCYAASGFIAAATFHIYVGYLCIPAAVVVGLLVLKEIHQLRLEVMQRYGLTSKVHELESQQALWAGASLLGWILIGVLPAIVQTLWFFGDHAKLADELASRNAAPKH